MCPVFYVIKASPGVTSGSEKVKCAGVRSGRCGWEERRGEGDGTEKKLFGGKTRRRAGGERASSTL